jgi:hypothetical protein
VNRQAGAGRFRSGILSCQASDSSGTNGGCPVSALQANTPMRPDSAVTLPVRASTCAWSQTSAAMAAAIPAGLDGAGSSNR